MTNNKLIISIKYDGFQNTARNILKKVFNLFGRASKTLFLRKEQVEYIKLPDIGDSYSYQKITDIKDVVDCKHEKLISLPINKWLNNGATCFLILHEKEPVAYGWLHKNEYQFEGSGLINLSNENKAWLGPVFVNKDFRRKGLNSFQISLLINEAKRSGINIIETSLNSNNVASYASFIKYGFSCYKNESSKYFMGMIIEKTLS